MFRWRKSAILPAIALVVGGCSQEPFRYVKATGKITYQDGSLIPARRIRLTFISQSPPKDAKTVPLPAKAEVNVATGEFKEITSHQYGDGVLAGKHKVVVDTSDLLDAAQAAMIPPDYTDEKKTPLEVDTLTLPWVLTIPKP